MTKACTKCGTEKPLERFPKDSRRPYGRGSNCRDCRASNDRAYKRREEIRTRFAVEKQSWIHAAEEGATRICGACGVEQLASGFRPKHKICRACWKKREAERRANPEWQVYLRRMRRSAHYREGAWRRAQKPEAKAKRLEKARMYQHDPFKQRARRLLNQAVKSGKVLKPDHCEHCRQQLPRRRIHGHHPDYSKPLDVKWLCALCHAREHWDYSVEDVA